MQKIKHPETVYTGYNDAAHVQACIGFIREHCDSLEDENQLHELITDRLNDLFDPENEDPSAEYVLDDLADIMAGLADHHRGIAFEMISNRSHYYIEGHNDAT